MLPVPGSKYAYEYVGANTTYKQVRKIKYFIFIEVSIITNNLVCIHIILNGKNIISKS